MPVPHHGAPVRSRTPTVPPPGRLLLTVPEFAAMLAFGRAKTYEIVRRGEVETILIGGSRRVPVDAAVQYVEKIRAEQRSA